MCRIVLTGRSHLSTTGWAEPFRKEEVDRGGGKTGRNPWLPEGQPREKEGPTTGESDRGERVSKTQHCVENANCRVKCAAVGHLGRKGAHVQNRPEGPGRFSALAMDQGWPVCLSNVTSSVLQNSPMR